MIVFDFFFFLLGMQAVSLLQIDGKQTASGTDTQHKQGDAESKEDISGNEAEEGCSEGGCGNEDKASPDAHKLQGHLETFIHGVACVVRFHSLIAEELRQGNGHRYQCGTTANGHHDGLLDILVAVVHLVEHIEGSNDADHCSNHIEKVSYWVDVPLEGTYSTCDGTRSGIGHSIARAHHQHQRQAGESQTLVRQLRLT